MKEKQLKNVVEVRIVELEDKLMDVIEMANNYPDNPVLSLSRRLMKFLQKSKI